MKKTTALITGASVGIGRAFAHSLAKRGHDLIINSRRKEVLDELAAELRTNYDVQVEVAAFDLNDSEALNEFALQEAEKARIGILINNAGFGAGKPFSKGEYADQQQLLRVHIDAATRLSHAVLPGMKSRGEGAIINVASLAGFIPNPADALYSATKAYLIRFSESLHLELGQYGIISQALCPGFIRTEFHERLGQGKDFNKRNRGIFQWMEADTIAEASLNALEKRKPPVILVPGRFYRFLFGLNRVLPRAFVYRQALRRYKSRI